jgi:hypothetical protein
MCPGLVEGISAALRQAQRASNHQVIIRAPKLVSIVVR